MRDAKRAVKRLFECACTCLLDAIDHDTRSPSDGAVKIRLVSLWLLPHANART